MSISDSYNSWAAQYDTNINKTRDLEGKAIKNCLRNIAFDTCLEIGCGTGKNTEWLTGKANVTGVDFSEAMLEVAKNKSLSRVKFIQADITKQWDFTPEQFDLVSFSLVLEHVEDLHHIFKEAASRLKARGYLYLGELHPFKQYAGSKARFDNGEGRQELTCYTHHVSDFTRAASRSGFTIVRLEEYFDDHDANGLPGILSILFQKLHHPSAVL